MLRLEDLITYLTEEGKEELTKCSFDVEIDETGDFIVTKTKETYVFEDEVPADNLISDARTQTWFAGCDKKFKLGKVNKDGDLVRPDQWTVVIKTKRD